MILLCLAGGGWVVRLYVRPSALTSDRTVLADAPSPAMATFRQILPPGRPSFVNGNLSRTPNRGNGGGPVVQTRRDDSVEVRSPKAHVQFASRYGNRLTVEQANYFSVDFIPREARNTDDLRRVIDGRDRDKVIAAMSLTPDQLNRLRRLPRLPGMVLTEPDRAKLTADYVSYRDAPAAGKAAAQAKLTASIDDVAGKSEPATAKAYVDQAASINEIVKPDQWAKYQAFGGGR